MVNKYVTNFSHCTLFRAIYLDVPPPLWNLNYYFFLLLGKCCDSLSNEPMA